MLYKINTRFMKYETEESVATLLEDLESQNKEITTLDLSLNTFIPPIFSKICDKIKSMKSLKIVILESVVDSLTFEEMCEVLDSLGSCLSVQLQSLELPSNALSCNFPEKFANFLSKCPLKLLNLHNCGLGEDGLKRITECLMKVENKENLVSLDLSKNRINVICPEFTTTLSLFPNISKLVLNANTIEEKSMGNFLSGLKNEKIEILNLTDNFVCGEAVEPLGDLFLRNNIKELYLQDIKADDGDINKFLEKITSFTSRLPGGLEDANPSLILDISCNNLDQNCISLLEKLLDFFVFEKLVIFESSYENCENLKKQIISNGGRLVEEEEEEFEPIDENILDLVKKL